MADLDRIEEKSRDSVSIQVGYVTMGLPHFTVKNREDEINLKNKDPQP
jgi:hypothetical protein